MLTLYSFGPGANSLKPMLTLFEKFTFGQQFTVHQLNPRNFEHHADWFKALNPRGQVPALEDANLPEGANIITESTVICEYLEDAHPTAVKLRPASHYDVAQMRCWTKWVDEYFCWCVSTIGWHRHVSTMVKDLSEAEFEEVVARIPVFEQQVKWRRAREGFPADLLDEEMRKVAVSVRKLDDHLADNEWLAGGVYSLADICNYSTAAHLTMGYDELVNASDSPHLLRWIDQIKARPAVVEMYAKVPREF
jgi:glutathione S-transferase